MLIEDERWRELMASLEAALRRIDALEALTVMDPDDATWLAGEVVHGPQLSAAFVAHHELAARTVGSSDEPPSTVMGFQKGMMRRVQYPRCFVACGANDPGKVALLESRIDSNGVIVTHPTFFADAPEHLMKELAVLRDGVPSAFTSPELIAMGWPVAHRFAAECLSEPENDTPPASAEGAIDWS